MLNNQLVIQMENITEKYDDVGIMQKWFLLFLKGLAPQCVLLTQLPCHLGPLHLAFFSSSRWPADDPQEPSPLHCSYDSNLHLPWDDFRHEHATSASEIWEFYPTSPPLRLQHHLVTLYRQAQWGLWWSFAICCRSSWSASSIYAVFLMQKGVTLQCSAANWAVQNIQRCSAIFKRRGVVSPM